MCVAVHEYRAHCLLMMVVNSNEKGAHSLANARSSFVVYRRGRMPSTALRE